MTIKGTCEAVNISFEIKSNNKALATKMLLSELEKGINRTKAIFAKSNDRQLEDVIRKLNYLKEEN